MAPSQQQHQLPITKSQPLQQQTAYAGSYPGYTVPHHHHDDGLRLSLLASSPMTFHHANLSQKPALAQHCNTQGVPMRAAQAKLATALIQTSEQPALYPPAPLLHAAAAAGIEGTAQYEAAVPGRPEAFLGVNTAKISAHVPQAASVSKASAAVVSEMALERYIDLHAALERGTGREVKVM